MALPTLSDMTGFQFSYLGQPFVESGASTSIDLTHFGFSFVGQPFVRNANTSAVVSSEVPVMVAFNF